MFNYLPDNAPTYTHPTHTPLLTKADVPMSRVTSPQSLVHGMLVLSLPITIPFDLGRCAELSIGQWVY